MIVKHADRRRSRGRVLLYPLPREQPACRACSGDVLTESTALELARRIRVLYDALREGLVALDEALYLALLAAAAGEHLLLVGPPGTAKSELARRLHLAFADARYFERLLTRFSVPEELFGPLSLKALERDSYERLIDGYLPSAHVAFLDEIFEANSAILNALLGILNERVFDNGAQRRPVPLACVIAASNEIPDNVPALSDRFLVRLLVEPVSDDGFDALLGATAVTPPSDEDRLRFEELSTIRDSANRVDVPGWTIDLIRSVRTALSAKGIYVSDRRWRKTIHLLRTSAVLAGRDSVVLADLGVLSHALWQQLTQRPIVDEILAKVAAETLDAEPERYRALVETLEDTLAQERNAKTGGRDDVGQLYRDPKGAVTHEAATRRHKKNRFGELLFESPTTRAPVTLEDLRGLLPDLGAVRAYASDPTKWIVDEIPHEAVVSTRRYSKDHVSARVVQVDRILQNLRSFREELGAASGVDSRQEGASEVDCLAPPRARFAESSRRALSRLTALSERLETLRRGFASLPTEEVGSEVTA
ncbi:MAG TPA: AAA family ATPase [Labilithrix sp.]|nr:AAA family ATPase [Labilithrix sp.]